MIHFIKEDLMMDYKKYIEECKLMANKKKQDENLKIVYSDVDFEKLAFECQEYIDYLNYAEGLFTDE